VAESDLAELSSGLDEAVQLSHLPNPAKIESVLEIGRNASDSRSYIWALRSRLIALGYLGKEDNQDIAEADSRFVKAVRRFQRDVGDPQILLDGWAGPVTWRALQCLVSFEDKQEPLHWPVETDYASSPAIARAAYLRLWVMGFFDNWKRHRLRRGIDPTLKNPACRRAYEKFWRFATRLGLAVPSPDRQLEFSRESLCCLFDHDGIVAALGSERFDRMSDFTDQLEAIARIELWLHGFDCEPGPPERRSRRRGPPGKSRRRVRLVGQDAAIEDFWKANDPDRSHPIGVGRALFAEFSKELEESRPSAAQYDAAIRKIDQLDEDDRNILEERLAGLASLIWDGMKRLVKTLWRFIRGAIRSVGTMLKNLARLVARESRRFFHLVVRAVDVVQAGVDYLKHTIYPAMLPQPVIIARGGDFDHNMLIAPGGIREVGGPLLHYRQFAAHFNAGCVIIGELLFALREVLTMATRSLAGPVAWLRALLSLGRIRESVAEVKLAITTLKDYEVRGEHAGAIMRFDIA
jgi:hypothetical protein